MPDDLSDRHVPHCVQKGLSTRTAATVSLLSLLLSRPPSCHRGEICWWEKFNRATGLKSPLHFIVQVVRENKHLPVDGISPSRQTLFVPAGWLVFPSTF